MILEVLTTDFCWVYDGFICWTRHTVSSIYWDSSCRAPFANSPIIPDVVVCTFCQRRNNVTEIHIEFTETSIKIHNTSIIFGNGFVFSYFNCRKIIKLPCLYSYLKRWIVLLQYCTHLGTDDIVLVDHQQLGCMFLSKFGMLYHASNWDLSDSKCWITCQYLETGNP